MSIQSTSTQSTSTQSTSTQSTSTRPAGAGSPGPAPLDQLWVTSWDDPDTDPDGFDPRSAYVEQFWLGVMGPSTVWLLRYCRATLDDSPDGFVLDLTETAAVLGLGHRGGRNSPLVRTIARACRFHAARQAHEAQLEVRRFLPPLHRAQLARLPEVLQHRHARFLGDRRPGDAAGTRRARRLALGLVACGDGVDLAEHQLGQWRVEPSVAAEAVRWAWEVHHGDGAEEHRAATAVVGGAVEG